jgi:hypothetical protein
LILLRQ